ncbi:hypothetical protein B0F90DRAFT_1816388 [Multifurca ochricompacta]|uniref:DUF6533 domain-containing protein n=1 Tax=Multifurca ochricompacta TaxID=376703 RepID=A0AAD4M611_9AGAM|nr:hypothetical protein B0F90DRAFT_1816388 [Multifurca ochricompacta]
MSPATETEWYLHLNYFLNIIPLVILYYDYVLTFSWEVECFWPHRYRMGWVSFMFFLNRYMSIFGYIPLIMGLSFKKSFGNDLFCQRMDRYNEYFEMLLQSLVAVLCAVRVYALYNKNVYILGGLVTLIVATIAVGFAAIATESGDVMVHIPQYGIRGCGLNLALSDEGGHFLAIAWSGFLAFDIIVFGLTLYRAIKVGYNVPLIQVLVRDGSLYFM